MPIGTTRRSSCEAVEARRAAWGRTDAGAFVSRTAASGAIDAFSRRPLCPASRAFTGPILNGSKGSILPVRYAIANDSYLRIAVVHGIIEHPLGPPVPVRFGCDAALPDVFMALASCEHRLSPMRRAVHRLGRSWIGTTKAPMPFSQSSGAASAGRAGSPPYGCKSRGPPPPDLAGRSTLSRQDKARRPTSNDAPEAARPALFRRRRMNLAPGFCQ
jgi:hypothetical protein